jgi:hypothetical protein
VENNTENYIGYEYKNVFVWFNMESLYKDNYPCFGWILEKESVSLPGSPFVEMRFKRNRKIRNRMELTRLQNQFDFIVKKIVKLERGRTSIATALSLTIALIGTAFIALSVFAYLDNVVRLCVLFAIPGFVGWVIPYSCYKKIYRKNLEQIKPLIEKNYDDIYKVCEKAHFLLGTQLGSF